VEIQRDAVDIINETGVETPATRAIAHIGCKGAFEQNTDRDLWRLLNKQCVIPAARLLVQLEVNA